MARHRVWRCFPALLAVLFFAAWAVAARAGEDPVARAGALIERVGALNREGKPDEALPLAVEALGLLEAATGPDSPEVGAVCAIAASLHDAREDYGAAVPLHERALAIQEKALGPRHPRVAATLADLAWDIEALGDPARARPLYERALAIREETLGPDHPDTAVSLNNLAALEESFGEHAAARGHYERALAINEKALGPDHPETANSCNNLAGVLASLALHDEARSLYERALAIQEKTLGAEHLKLAATLNNLAQLDQAVGAYERARPLLERSQAIREKALGPGHPDVALGRNNLAGLLGSLGEYDQAKPLYEQSLADLEKALGPGHPHVAVCLANLASVLSAMGDAEAAASLLNRSIAIWEKARGPENEDVARPLHNLALLHHARGDHAAAEALLERARGILEKALGPEHPLVATVENSQAGVAAAQGRLDRARAQNERALAIREKVLGPRHLDTAISLSNLAGVHADQGDIPKAVGLYERSLSIMEEAVGPRHPYTARVVYNLARVTARSGDTGRAFALMRRGQAIDAASIEPIMAIASDAQKLKYLATLEANLHDFQSLAAGALGGSPEARLAAFESWIGRKGIVLEAQRRFQEALFLSADAETARLAGELAETRARLSRLTFTGPGNLPPEALREETAALRQRKERLEAELSARASRFARAKKRDGATAATLAAALPAGSVLLEFCRHEVSDFTAVRRKTGTFRYLAYLLPAGRPEGLALVDLGDAGAIDRAVASLRAAIRNPGAEGGRQAAQAARALHDLVFAPLRGPLGQARSLFISPDGNLNLVPFEVLLDPDGRYLIEDFTCNYLSAGRDLLDFAPAGERPAGEAVLFGDPDFNRPAAASPRPDPAPPGQAPEGVSRAMADLRFSRLPGTREEVLALAGLLGPKHARVFLESRADEESLARIQAPRILHLATHGFFLGDQTLASLLGPDAEGAGAPGTPPVLRGGFENPLLRSGLALAGANTALSARDRQEGRGIVTAEKILGLPLGGTEMVVLSACETGLGEVRAGEGVFGLRRAFAQAGARSLVMSLWSVPDQETMELMVGFYRTLARGGVTRCEALRRAALDEMAVVRERHGQAHPFFWGAFVFLGQP